MRNKTTVGLGTAAVFLLLGHVAAQDKKMHIPGSSTNLPWTAKDINAAREAGKPILLYVYDPLNGKIANHDATFYETKVFADPAVKDAVKDFLVVKLSVRDTSWPPQYIAPAVKSAVVYLMTCDANPRFTFGDNKPRTVREGKEEKFPEFAQAAKMVVGANPQAAEAMKKKPPPKYVPPAKKEAAQAKDEPPAEPKKAEIPGMEEEKRGADKKGEAKKAEPEKKPAKKEEDE